VYQSKGDKSNADEDFAKAKELGLRPPDASSRKPNEKGI
jgi:hypothetical protein